MGEITFTVPTLQRLSLFMADDWDLYGYVIDTPSLKYFKLEDWNYWRHDIEIKDMPELKEAYVDVVSPVLKSVIGSITSVKHLTICSEISKSGGEYSGGFVFNQLKHLKHLLCGWFACMVRFLFDKILAFYLLSKSICMSIGGICTSLA